MNCKVQNFYIILLFLIVICIVTTNAIPCDSCGNECASACGTKHFRTCCFNYLRKRTDPDALKLSTNKRLIDFILLQGHALFTQNELSRAAEAEAVAVAEAEAEAQKNNNIYNKQIHGHNKNNKNGIFDVELQSSSYYG